MDWKSRIEADPEVLSGKAVIKGFRIAVELIVDRLARGWIHSMLLEAYPRLSADDILAALAFAAGLLGEERYIAAAKTAARATCHRCNSRTRTSRHRQSACCVGRATMSGRCMRRHAACRMSKYCKALGQRWRLLS